MKLSKKQRHRKRCICEALRGTLTNQQVAVELGITKRQVKNIKASFKIKGDCAFIHGNTGRKSTRAYSEQFKQNIITIKEISKGEKKIYTHVNFTHFRDILEEYHEIKISKTSLYKILKKAGYKSPKKRRRIKHKQTHFVRLRRLRFGELIQADGTRYDWFFNGKLYCLHALVDDATGIPVGLYMTKNECTFGYAEALRYMITHYGIPEQLYTDLSGVFYVNNRKATIQEQLQNVKPKTQFAKQMDELGIQMIPAYSSQAKGRVERFWQTIQSRLPVEFAINDIKTVEQANAFFPQFIKKFTKWFGVKPASPESSFVKMNDTSILSKILAIKLERKTDSCGVVTIKGYQFEIKNCVRKNVKIYISHHDGIYAITKSGQKLPVRLLSSDPTTTQMPEVWQDLIDEYLLKDSKSNYREAC